VPDFSGLPSERELIERDKIVVQPRVQDQLRRLTSFTEEMQLRGLSTKSKIIDFQVVTDEAVVTKMEIPADEEFVRLQRLRFVKREPIAIQTALR